MSHTDDRQAATGLLDELDDIRSLLDGQSATDDLPVLDDVPTLEDAVAPDDDAIPVLDDAVFDDRTIDRWTGADELARDESTTQSGDAAALTEVLIAGGLGDAIGARIDATLEHWVSETLQVELALLRARLQDAVRTEVENFVTAEINRSTVIGKPHAE